MSEKETDQQLDAAKVSKELQKINVIDSQNVAKISVPSASIDQMINDPRIAGLKPCLYFPDQEKMIVFDIW